MSPQIPDPEYVVECVEGAVYDLSSGSILVVGPIPNALRNHQPQIAGNIVLRYGLTTLIPVGDVLIPGLLAAEKGGMLTGREAWDFLQRQFQMHPRADVVGVGLMGQPVQKLVREIDFGIPVRVFAYGSYDQAIPSAELNGMVVMDDANMPTLAAQYLPQVSDLDSLMPPTA
jgi:hypothetical protein